MTSVIVSFHNQLDQCGKDHNDAKYKQKSNVVFYLIVGSLVISCIYLLREVVLLVMPPKFSAADRARTIKKYKLDRAESSLFHRHA